MIQAYIRDEAYPGLICRACNQHADSAMHVRIYKDPSAEDSGGEPLLYFAMCNLCVIALQNAIKRAEQIYIRGEKE